VGDGIAPGNRRLAILAALGRSPHRRPVGANPTRSACNLADRRPRDRVRSGGQFDPASFTRFRFLLLPLLFLALYYTTIEFAIGAALAVANIVAVALATQAPPMPGRALLAALVLVALGTLVRRVVSALERSRGAAAAARRPGSAVLSDLAQSNQELRS